MNIKKSIQLTTKPLEELLNNGESIDFRLDAEAWKDLQIGDHIEFWEDLTGWQTKPTEDARKAIVEIKQIYRAPTFLELFDEIEKDLSILKEHNDLLNGLRDWWNEEKETKTGTLAFYIKLIN